MGLKKVQGLNSRKGHGSTCSRASEAGQRKGCSALEEGMKMSLAVVVTIIWALYGFMLYWIYRIDLMRDAIGENGSPFLA